jgi:hypothetical protein
VDPDKSLHEGAQLTAILLLLIGLWVLFPHSSNHPECALRGALHGWLHR